MLYVKYLFSRLPPNLLPALVLGSHRLTQYSLQKDIPSVSYLGELGRERYIPPKKDFHGLLPAWRSPWYLRTPHPYTCMHRDSRVSIYYMLNCLKILIKNMCGNTLLSCFWMNLWICSEILINVYRFGPSFPLFLRFYNFEIKNLSIYIFL